MLQLADDASRDDTVAIACRLGIDVRLHSASRGFGGNQRNWNEDAPEQSADIVAMLHADYPYELRSVPAMTAITVSGTYDLVAGSRVLGGVALRGGMAL